MLRKVLRSRAQHEPVVRATIDAARGQLYLPLVGELGLMNMYRNHWMDAAHAQLYL